MGIGNVSTTQASDPNYPYWEKGNTLPKVPVYASSGTTQANGNATVTMDFPTRELFITNDGTGNMTFVITGSAGLNMGFMLQPGEIFNERLPLFTTLTVTAPGLWRWYVRAGRVA